MKEIQPKRLGKFTTAFGSLILALAAACGGVKERQVQVQPQQTPTEAPKPTLTILPTQTPRIEVPTPLLTPTPTPESTATPTPEQPKPYSVLRGSWQGSGPVVAVFFPEDILLMVESTEGSYVPCLKDAGVIRFYNILNRHPDGVFRADDGRISAKTTVLSTDRVSGTVQITNRGCISAEMRWQATFVGVGEGTLKEFVTYLPALQSMLRDIERLRR